MGASNKHSTVSLLSKILNVIGLTVAFAAFYIIMVQVNYGLDYNSSVKNADRIYAVSSVTGIFDGGYSTFSNQPPMEQIIANCPDIEAGGFFQTGRPFLFFNCAHENFNPTSPKVWSSFNHLSRGAIETFELEALEGSWGDLVDMNHIAITKSFSELYGFHLGDIIHGESMNFGGEFIVSVIYEDLPTNSDFGKSPVLFVNKDYEENWSEWSFPYYFKIAQNANYKEVEAKATELYQKAFYNQLVRPNTTQEEVDEFMARTNIHLVPIADLYFDETIEVKQTESGSKTTTAVLVAIAILIIAIALINFVNFFMALVPSKVHSVNTRKVLGAGRTELVLGFVRDSLVLGVISLGLAAAVILLFGQSDFAHLISYTTAFSENVGLCVLTVILALVAVAAASLSPAFYITSFSPALVLKGSFATSGRGRVFRNVLVGVQFAISMAMIMCSSFIVLQRKFMEKHDMGFNRENLLIVQTRFNASEAVENKLRQNPEIKDVTWSNGDLVADTRMGWGRTFRDEQINFTAYPVAWNFLRFMGIEVVEGRDFTKADMQCENGVFIFNETAKAQFEFTLDDKLGGHADETEIAGFCRDFNFKALRQNIGPICLYVFGKNQWSNYNMLYVRTEKNCDLKSVISYIQDTVCEYDQFFTKSDVDVQLFDKKIQKSYEEEKNLSMLITLFTILAILISLIGVFGLVMFETEHKRKEIGIRRVNGASVESILVLFNKMFIKIVAICFVIATPVSYFILKSYLQQFAYKVPLYWWVFVLVLVATLIVTIAVVTARSYRAATLNPSETLKKD